MDERRARIAKLVEQIATGLPRNDKRRMEFFAKNTAHLREQFLLDFQFYQHSSHPLSGRSQSPFTLDFPSALLNPSLGKRFKTIPSAHNSELRVYASGQNLLQVTGAQGSGRQ